MSARARLRVMVALGGFAAVLALPLVATPAANADSCSDVVVDNADVLGAKLAAVQQAASDLQAATGAEVRVWTVPDLGTEPTLDSLVKHWCLDCGSLTAPGGGLKTTVIVFAMSYSGHDVGIFYGDAWKNAFSGANSETRIWQDFMVPQFQNGDFGQGFINGMKEAQRVLNEYLYPGQTPSTAGSPIIGWTVLGVVVALGGGLGGRQLARSAKARRAAAAQAESVRQAAREKLAASRDAVMGGLLELDARKADVDVATVYEPVSADVGPARAAYLEAMAAANEDILGDATNERDDLTTQQYEAAQKVYDAAGEQVEKARQAVADIGRIEGEVKQAMDDLPATLKDEAAKNKQAQALAADLAAGGLLIPADIQAGLASLDGALTEAQAAAGTMAVVLPALAALRRKRDDLVDGVKAVKAQADEVASELKTLTGAVAALDMEACQARLAKITDGYDEACWQGAPDTFASAQAAKERADKSLAMAQGLSKDQNWTAAAQAANDGFAAVDDFKGRAVVLGDVLESLQQAPARLKMLHESAQRAIDAAWEYARSNTDDDAAHEAEITKAEHALAAADVTGHKPDWIAAIALAEAAETIAQQALASCKSEVARAERDRIDERKRQEHEKALQDRIKRLRTQLAEQAEADSRGSFWGFSSGGSSDGGFSSGSSFSSGGGFSGSSGSFSGGGGFSGSSGKW